jgi:hypothetical protein
VGRMVDALVKEGNTGVIITNPDLGDFKTKTAADKFKWITRLAKEYPLIQHWIPAFKITPKTSITDVANFLKSFPSSKVMLVHWGELKSLHANIAHEAPRIDHLFLEAKTSTAYRNTFTGTRILARDGFNCAERNADYPPHEVYDDLNVTYSKPHMMSGFSDFTITGSGFKEGGGPAHAVAIHLTYKRPSKDIGIHHFVSDDITIPPNDNALKIGQSLKKLVAHVDANPADYAFSDAVGKFKFMYTHNDGSLAKLKQLAIEHHLELMNELV